MARPSSLCRIRSILHTSGLSPLQTANGLALGTWQRPSLHPSLPPPCIRVTCEKLSAKSTLDLS
eukprot:scaffold232304_cov36-Tisochrysis_lutea.AAC.3